MILILVLIPVFIVDFPSDFYFLCPVIELCDATRGNRPTWNSEEKIEAENKQLKDLKRSTSTIQSK